MESYRFMTCNIRLQTMVDGAQQFIHRADFLCNTLNTLAPDVIGFQEMTPAMRIIMMEKMPDYAFLGGGREHNRLGESPAIAYRQTRFMPERLTTDLLSFTPHVPGSTYGGDQSPCPRAFCTADFMPLAGGQPLRFANVHTDHVGENARRFATLQMLQTLSNQQAIRPMATVLTGDMNALPNTPEIEMITCNNNIVFTDATAEITGTFHDYGRLAKPEKIDYIFISNHFTLQTAKAYHVKQGDLFLSDHDPVMITVTLP